MARPRSETNFAPPTSLREFFISEGEPNLVRRRLHVYEQGGTADTLYMITRGVIITRRISSKSGKRIMESVWRSGDYFGVESVQDVVSDHDGTYGVPLYGSTTVAAVNTEIIGVRYDKLLLKGRANPDLFLDLGQVLSRHTNRQQGLIQRFSDAQSRKTTLATVWAATRELMDNPRGRVLVSQGDQASRLGLDRMSLSRILKKHPEIPANRESGKQFSSTRNDRGRRGSQGLLP